MPAGLETHIIMDHRDTHKTALSRNWLAKRPRFHLHFTPTYASRINLVERWFAEITHKRIRRGVLRSVKELGAAVRECIDVHNENPKALRLDENSRSDSRQCRPFRPTYMSISTGWTYITDHRDRTLAIMATLP